MSLVVHVTRVMKPNYVDAALMAVLGLLALGGVLHSAMGRELIGPILAIFLSAAVIMVSCVLVSYRRYTKRAVLPALIGPVLCLFIIISAGMTSWPLRVIYALSRDALDSLAHRVRAGGQISTPVRAGFFTIKRLEISAHNIVCLWTYPRPAGNTGFVQCRRDYVPFNLWSLIRLDNDWQFISED